MLQGGEFMSNDTIVNPVLDSTVINNELMQSTEINPDILSEIVNVSSGTVLGKKYTIIESLCLSSGEADLYICAHNNKKYVAKVYKRKHAVKDEIVNVLKSIDSPYVAKLYDAGTYEGHQYEILPYFKNGSLRGKKYTLTELRTMIIPDINEGLKVLHSKDIIHKDLKPSNIMISDDGKSIAIIDFGISSVVDEGNTVLVTQTGMTPEYSAPETFRNLYHEVSDYYSFGITIYELFTGYTPYKNMNADEIARFTAIQRIPFPKDMPKDLQDLISAMTYFDITNRNNKSNPNRRWSYEEVKKWCIGVKQSIPGEGIISNVQLNIPPYRFLGREYRDVPELVTALALNWNDGKKQLYRGLLSGFFKNYNPEVAGYCMDAEDELSEKKDNEDRIFWNLLYKLNPYLVNFYWKGQSFESVPQLGYDMLQHLWNNDKSQYEYWNSILENKLLSSYLKNKSIQNIKLYNAVSALESSKALTKKNSRDILLTYYTMAYLISGQRILNIDNKILNSVNELTSYMNTLLVSSYDEFEDFCQKLLETDDKLNVQFEAWLISLGKREQLERWKQQLS